MYGGLVGSCRLRALRVTAVHIDVIEQLASLVDMRLRGVGRNDELFRNVVDGISACDVFEDFAFALRKREFFDCGVADFFDFRRSRRRLDQLYDGAFLAKQRNENHRKQTEEEDGRAG